MSAAPARDVKAGTKTATIPAGALSTTVDVLTYANTTVDGDRRFSLVCAPMVTTAINQYDIAATDTIRDED